MKIIQTVVSTDGVDVTFERDDGLHYVVSVLPKNDRVLLHFSGLSDRKLTPELVAANQVKVGIGVGTG